MPRPKKHRLICSVPACTSFGPCGKNALETITMTVDEYEVIRLIDMEELTQEQCAEQMGVARTTVQAIYSTARRKIAQCLVLGCHLYIDGGDVRFCEHQGQTCGMGCRRRKKQFENTNNKTFTEQNFNSNDIGGNKMKIAVTYENGDVFQHFGHTEQFKVYETENGKILSSSVIGTDGNGHGALAGMLKNMGINTLICGGIGEGAKRALEESGIKFYGGVSGSADMAVSSLLNGTLSFNPDITCNHHNEHHEHSEHCGGNCHAK